MSQGARHRVQGSFTHDGTHWRASPRGIKRSGWLWRSYKMSHGAEAGRWVLGREGGGSGKEAHRQVLGTDRNQAKPTA